MIGGILFFIMELKFTLDTGGPNNLAQMLNELLCTCFLLIYFICVTISIQLLLRSTRRSTIQIYVFMASSLISSSSSFTPMTLWRTNSLPILMFLSQRESQMADMIDGVCFVFCKSLGADVHPQ
jgi:hypothetical protein